MPARSLALCLTDPTNDFQQLLQKDAEEAARRAGLGIVVRYSGHDLAAQLKELDALAVGTPRPDAILVLAVRDRGLDRVALAAVKAGVSWAFLNRTEDDVDALRAAAPQGAIACTVCADELETGRIQGRQFRALLARRPGARVLYVQGSRRSLAARDRTTGMEEAVKGSGLEVVLLEGGWTAAEAKDAVRRWLGIAARGGGRIDLVGCQNDQIAQGTLEAFAEMARELSRRELAQVVVTGCDGTPQLGQRLVREGRLRATVALARSSGPAVDLVARALTGGTPPPPLTLLKGISFPAESTLVALPPV